MPFISTLCLNFLSDSQVTPVREEFLFNSVGSQNLNLDYVIDVVNEKILGELFMRDIDVSNSYIGINWQYLMNLKSKIDPVELPNMIGYYTFIRESDDDLALHTVGIQADSNSQMQQWLRDAS